MSWDPWDDEPAPPKKQLGLAVAAKVGYAQTHAASTQINSPTLNGPLNGLLKHTKQRVQLACSTHCSQPQRNLSNPFATIHIMGHGGI